MSSRFFLSSVIAWGLLLGACSRQPAPQFQTSPVPNPNAPMAFFSDGSNINHEMRMEYATALQNSGLYNFVLENFSEEQVKNAVEIRINYSEERGKFTGIPVLVLKTEFIKEEFAWFKFTIRETSDKNNLFSPLSKIREKNYRKQLLLERFLEEVRRVTVPPSKSCKG
ncbi:MAG: hypothetical protein LBQ87_08740 [Candidatus Fibromonas sp.]|jgi:hypothetical protein|nr:hypothetical protein [Candidatus Fibromonas sp.]